MSVSSRYSPIWMVRCRRGQLLNETNSKIDILYFRYPGKDKKTTESVISSLFERHYQYHWFRYFLGYYWISKIQDVCFVLLCILLSCLLVVVSGKLKSRNLCYLESGPSHVNLYSGGLHDHRERLYLITPTWARWKLQKVGHNWISHKKFL